MARADDIARWVGLFVPPGQITELRALRVGGSETWSGFFSGDDPGALAQAALELEPRAGGLYFVPNPIAVPAKAKLGAVARCGKGDSTTDAMIARRTWLLIDIDPVRFGFDGKPLDDPTCPATDREREAAWQVLQRCRGALDAFGLRGEVVGDSCNGWHLCYPIDLPNDDASRALAKGVLATLEARSGDAKAHVDLKTFNAARIWKLYGTRARKGAETPDRPFRYSQAVVKAGTVADRTKNTAALRRAVETWSKQDALRQTRGSDPGAYGRKALEAEVGKVATAPPGQRNNTLNAAAFALGQLVAGGELNRGDVETALMTAATAAKLSQTEAAHTIKSGLDAGAKEPRKAPAAQQAAQTGQQAGEQAPPEQPRDAGVSCADLMAMELPEPRYAVAGFLPEGVTILAGRPKARKSWLALQLALGVAQGAKVLGTIETAPGDVLYLALEDTRRRLKKRVRKIIDKTGWVAPGRLEFRVESARMSAALPPIEAWIKAHPDARLVIIDTLQKIRPVQKAGNKDGYADDYNVLSDIKQLADRHAVAVLILHHSRKASAESPFDEISGTLGLTGAADGMFLLQRDHDSDTAVLYMTGRDLEEETLQLAWDDAGCLWSISSRASGINRPVREPTVDSKKSPRLAECSQWLMRILVKGPVRVSAVRSEAEAAGYDAKLLYRAKDECHAVEYPDEKRSKWWKLPE